MLDPSRLVQLVELISRIQQCASESTNGITPMGPIGGPVDMPWLHFEIDRAFFWREDFDAAFRVKLVLTQFAFSSADAAFSGFQLRSISSSLGTWRVRL